MTSRQLRLQALSATLALLTLLVCGEVQAQRLTMELKAPDTVLQGTQWLLTIKADDLDGDAPLPELRGLVAGSFIERSYSTSFADGVATSSSSATLPLLADSVGDCRILDLVVVLSDSTEVRGEGRTLHVIENPHYDPPKLDSTRMPEPPEVPRKPKRQFPTRRI